MYSGSVAATGTAGAGSTASGRITVAQSTSRGPSSAVTWGRWRTTTCPTACDASAEGLVDQRLVGDDPGRLDAAARRDHDGGPGVVDADRQLRRREPAEDHGVDGADAGAGQHRDDGLGHHRHVDHDAVALLDAERAEHAGEAGDELEQLGVGVGAHGLRDRRVVDQGRLVGAAGDDVPVEGVVAGVEHAAGEPPVEGRGVVVEHPRRRGDPVDAGGRVAPEAGGVLEAAAMGLPVGGPCARAVGVPAGVRRHGGILAGQPVLRKGTSVIPAAGPARAPSGSGTLGACPST